VDATAGKPQLAQPGHATQEYRLHQPTFLDAVRTRLLAANLGTGSPRAIINPGRFGPRSPARGTCASMPRSAHGRPQFRR
jgi:hypothetical protein